MREGPPRVDAHPPRPPLAEWCRRRRRGETCTPTHRRSPESVWVTAERRLTGIRAADRETDGEGLTPTVGASTQTDRRRARRDDAGGPWKERQRKETDDETPCGRTSGSTGSSLTVQNTVGLTTEPDPHLRVGSGDGRKSLGVDSGGATWVDGGGLRVV